MRETEEVERFGLSLATTLSVISGEPPKLDQACFVGVQFQRKLVETFPQVLLEPLGIRAVFEAHHDIIGKTHHDYVTARMLTPPLIGPQIKHVMQVHIRKDG